MGLRKHGERPSSTWKFTRLSFRAPIRIFSVIFKAGECAPIDKGQRKSSHHCKVKWGCWNVACIERVWAARRGVTPLSIYGGANVRAGYIIPPPSSCSHSSLHSLSLLFHVGPATRMGPFSLMHIWRCAQTARRERTHTQRIFLLCMRRRQTGALWAMVRCFIYFNVRLPAAD